MPGWGRDGPGSRQAARPLRPPAAGPARRRIASQRSRLVALSGNLGGRCGRSRRASGAGPRPTRACQSQPSRPASSAVRAAVVGPSAGGGVRRRGAAAPTHLVAAGAGGSGAGCCPAEAAAGRTRAQFTWRRSRLGRAPAGGGAAGPGRWRRRPGNGGLVAGEGLVARRRGPQRWPTGFWPDSGGPGQQRSETRVEPRFPLPRRRARSARWLVESEAQSARQRLPRQPRGG
jgi:hypothetical protein